MVKFFKAILFALLIISVGVLSTNPWFFIYYVITILLSLALIAVFSICYSVTKKTHDWKKPSLYLIVACIPVLLSFCFTACLQSQQIEKQNRLINAVYNYRQINGRFPADLKDLKIPIDTLRVNYIPAETLQDFELYLKDLYGFPQHFSGRDSAWQKRVGS